jgi:hypothetical protein
MGSLPNRKLGNVIPFAGLGTQLGGSTKNALTYKPRSIHAEPMDVRNALAETVPGNTTELNKVRATQTRRTAAEALKQRNVFGKCFSSYSNYMTAAAAVL